MSALTNAATPRQVLTTGAWFGLVAGLIEGATLLALQRLGWLHWSMALLGVSLEILWISPIFDLLLFCAVGLGLIAGKKIFRQLPLMRVATFVFALLTFLDWSLISGRIRHSAALVLGIGLAVTLERWLRKRPERALAAWQKSLPWLFAATSLALVGVEVGLWVTEQRAVAQLPAARPGSPNILFIVVDTLRADHLSAYGYGRQTSPNLDRLAQEGALFENAFATSSWTLPSHASLLTGRYPYEHGAERNRYDGHYPTIAEALRDHGYRTAAFSANTLWFSRKRGFGRGFIHFEDYFGTLEDMAVRTLYGRKLEQFVLSHLGMDDLPARKDAADITRAVLRWAATERNRPFFAFLNYFDPHDPYLPPAPHRRQFSKLENPGGIINEFRFRSAPPLTPEQMQGEIDAYDGAVNHVDSQISRLLTELERRGFGQDLLVVITSDHGELFGEHGMLLHRNALYRELIRVPLILWKPSQIPAGIRVVRPVSNAALPATLVELASIADQASFPGPSLARLWGGLETSVDWPDALAELAQMPYEPLKKYPAYRGWMKSLVGPKWHYIEHETLGVELYDWVKDPGELNDLAATPEGHGVAREFASRLRSLLTERRRAGGNGSGEPPN